MPHSAGYFVLAYAWDHHCGELVQSIEKRLQEVDRALSELEYDNICEMESLLNYYKKWHRSSEAYRLANRDIASRQRVINSLGYRGYGVNRDLFRALGALRDRYAPLERRLEERFLRGTGQVQQLIYLPRECVESKRSDFIIEELSRKLGRDPRSQIPETESSMPLDMDHYFHVMTKETSWQANTAIFQKMFLSIGSSSMTIMKGSTGLHNGRSCKELKALGNRNFVGACHEMFSGLHLFTDIGIDLLKRMHYSLSRDFDAYAGNFRTIDFPDRNGVTFEFNNFQREIYDLSIVLGETGRSFHHLHEFIYNLARAYYMFIGIHPFWDCNGRVGRCFINYLLLKKGLPPVSLDHGQELFSLPRYGGSMEDMHNYLRGQLGKAIERYFYERWKLESFGLLHKTIRNVSFDSGFQFGQIESHPPKIEIHFDAYVVADGNLARILTDECRIVLPQDVALYDLTVFCGFCSGPSAEWHYCFKVTNGFCIKELVPEVEGVRVFDVDFLVQIPESARQFPYFSCSVTGDGGNLIFNNKGLNYSYHMK